MTDALLAARAKNGASLLVAACQAGITAIVRTLFDKELVQVLGTDCRGLRLMGTDCRGLRLMGTDCRCWCLQESDIEKQRVILNLDPDDQTVKSVAPEGEGESTMPRRDQSFSKSRRRSSSGHESLGSIAEPLPLSLSRSVSSQHASSFEDLPSASSDGESRLCLNALEAAIFAGPSKVIALACSLRATDCL
jgi:hypothetical protein